MPPTLTYAPQPGESRVCGPDHNWHLYNFIEGRAQLLQNPHATPKLRYISEVSPGYTAVKPTYLSQSEAEFSYTGKLLWRRSKDVCWAQNRKSARELLVRSLSEWPSRFPTSKLAPFAGAPLDVLQHIASYVIPSPKPWPH
jgi:hypothetical protein